MTFSRHNQCRDRFSFLPPLRCTHRATRRQGAVNDKVPCDQPIQVGCALGRKCCKNNRVVHSANPAVGFIRGNCYDVVDDRHQPQSTYSHTPHQPSNSREQPRKHKSSLTGYSSNVGPASGLWVADVKYRSCHMAVLEMCPV